MRILLIANPVAGRRAPRRIAAACRLLAEGGAEVELFETRQRGDAEQAAAGAAARGIERIVAAGGDGTLNEVISGLVPSPIPVAFLPIGTTNVCAYELGLPRSLAAACRVALEGDPKPVSLVRVNGRIALLMAGVGFDGEVVYGVSSRLKRLFGKGAYVLAALRRLGNANATPFTVRIDGRDHHAHGAILSNARSYGGGFAITPDASLQRREMEVCLLQRPGPRALLGLAGHVLLGRPLPAHLAQTVTAAACTIPDAGLPVQVDGDWFGRTPVEVGTSFGELLLVHPPQR